MKIPVLLIAIVTYFSLNAHIISALGDVKEIQKNTSVSPEDLPWRAQIAWQFDDAEEAAIGRSSKPTRFNCTGTIIHKFFILTAASCYSRVIDGLKHDDMPLSVNLRHINIRTFIRGMLWDGSDPPCCPNAGSQSQSTKGAVLHVHTNYLHRSTMFDVNIALLQTQLPWRFVCQPGPNYKYQPRIAMHIEPDDFIKCRATRMGFKWVNGVLMDGRTKFFEVKVGRENYCKYMQKKQNGRMVHFDSFYMCATPSETSVQEACNGDIGAPLFCEGLLAGIMSERREKKPCHEDGTSFFMYTAIGAPKVLDWIKSIVADFGGVLQKIPPQDPHSWTTKGTTWGPGSG